ncbi:TIGR03617 family F420-dependent LLM class oxidoreductase [Yinghuangia sp. ASG 101]|uniref:TIGR03617 family F420-dependent LLM class oxidoreductase n=1 Tax=Yinghuangia sp. ASG 101 TaxID=2896848 RepID=UPI001E3A5E1E|nr:TIGR03617 family F420-dependent LLM class oxidoreductase [Yinghuangia sp. ASG 101]UGQ11181.1 TIGR03617 family F420-dependent LLM class oxidoreductase [Yinghuangia sp. ASG 101]
MKVDGKLSVSGTPSVISAAQHHETAGYDGLWSSESKHDPFLPLLLAAEHTETLEVGTAIAVAFARSPMQLAYTAHDLQTYSGGRFMLGLGSQVKPHIERRFSMPWSRPAARMREYVSALRAIWSAWNDDTKLDFRGDFYTHTLMAPFFSPPPAPGGAPKVLIAAVGEAMTEAAGEVADGLLAHAFTTERYMREVTLPILERGLHTSDRKREDFILSHMPLVTTGRNEEEMARAVDGTKRQIAFYGSTPSYRPVLELHGWGELGDELNTLSKSSRDDKWQAMGNLVDDQVLNAFAVVAEPQHMAASIRDRFDGLVDRVSFYTAYDIDTRVWDDVVHELGNGGRA